MAMMCEECKCSTYYNEETDMYSCENECPCCNDPDWESDWDQHLRIMKQVREYVYLHYVSLNQDNDRIQAELDSMDIDSDEYKFKEIEDISVSGQIIATSHILKYLDEVANV
jgi:hypothetical protein